VTGLELDASGQLYVLAYAQSPDFSSLQNRLGAACRHSYSTVPMQL
jgi:hypothetical protein